MASHQQDPGGVRAAGGVVSQRRQKWRCLLCGAFGYGRTAAERLAGFEAHYWQTHVANINREEGP
jgi:hypothetical protein